MQIKYKTYSECRENQPKVNDLRQCIRILNLWHFLCYEILFEENPLILRLPKNTDIRGDLICKWQHLSYS